jgi:hypothetical protein
MGFPFGKLWVRTLGTGALGIDEIQMMQVVETRKSEKQRSSARTCSLDSKIIAELKRLSFVTDVTRRLHSEPAIARSGFEQRPALSEVEWAA